MSCAQPLLRLGASAGVEQRANSVAPPRTRRRCTAAISANVLGDRSMQSTQGWAGSTLLLDVRSPDHHLQGPGSGIILLPPVDVLVQDAPPARSFAHRLPVQPSAAHDPYEQPAPQRATTLQQGQPRVQPCSGAAVMMRIKACRDSQELDRCMEECLTLPAFHAMHAAAALTHLAQLVSHKQPGLQAADGLQHAQQRPGHVPEPPLGGQPGTQPATQLLQHPMAHVSRLAQLLVLHVWQRRAQLEPRQISNVLWALGRLHASRVQLCAEADSTQLPPQAARAHGKGHHLGRLIAHLAAWAAEHPSRFQSQELSCLLHGLAQLGYVPPNTQWLACMLSALQGSLEHMTPQGIANSVWAVSHWLCMDSGTVIAPRGPSIMLADTACPLTAPDLPAVPVLQRRAAAARWVPVRHWSVRVMPERPKPGMQGQSNAPLTDPSVPQPECNPVSQSACDVEASAMSMLQQLWRVTGKHLPAEACEPASRRSAQPARGSWPTLSLVLLSWSCARMQVLPPPSWQAGLAAATFPQLEHLSCQDTCNLAWAAARWRQLASCSSTSLTVSHAATLAMWGWADSALPIQPTQPQKHQQHRHQPRPVWALPPSWITRLSARVSDVVVTVAMDRAVRGRGGGVHLEPPGRAATWHATQQSIQTGAHSSAVISDRAIHPHALPALLWSAQQLPMALPSNQQNTVLACMLRVPHAFSPRDLILFASLEVEAAKRRAAVVVQPAPSSHSHRNAEDASRLTSISKKMQPVHRHTARPHMQQSTSTRQGSCADLTGHAAGGQTRVHAAVLEPCDRVLSPNVYQLVWAAARHLTHGSSQSLESQQQRVTLVALLAGMPQLCTATCRRVWRSVRAGLSNAACTSLTPGSSQGMAYAYSPHQATQILHDMTSTGYHMPAPDLLALLSMALAPLQQQQQPPVQPMPSASAAEMVINAAWAAVSCARAARISWRHRHMLSISPKAKQRWRRAQTSALAILERTQPGAAPVASPSPATSRSSPHTSRALADASAMLLWSLTDMGAPAVRIHNAWPESMVPAAATQLNPPAAPAMQRSNSGGALSHVYCVRHMPRLVLARGRSGGANPLRGQTMFKRGMRQFCQIRLRTAAPSHAPELRSGNAAPYAQLLPMAHLLRWLAVCVVHAQCMRPHALLLLVSAADRVPRRVMTQPAVHQALVRLLEVVAKRVPSVLPAFSSEELALLTARMARLAQCLHRQVTNEPQAISSSGASARAAVASGMPQLLRSLACMATVLEAEWERRSASVSWSQAARFQTALTRLLTINASGEEVCA